MTDPVQDLPALRPGDVVVIVHVDGRRTTHLVATEPVSDGLGSTSFTMWDAPLEVSEA